MSRQPLTKSCLEATRPCNKIKNTEGTVWLLLHAYNLDNVYIFQVIFYIYLRWSLPIFLLPLRRQDDLQARLIEEETAKRVEELVAERVQEELEKRKDEIEAEVLRRVEEAKKVGTVTEVVYHRA